MKKPQIVLLCAATSIEARACERGVKLSKTRNLFEILKTGIGMGHAARALEARLQQNQSIRPDCIVSTGFAGSLHDEIKLLSWIVARKVCVRHATPSDPGFEVSGLQLAQSLMECGLKSQAVEVETTESVAPAPHPSLMSYRAVDMESFALAQVAHNHSIDFQVLRLISDTPCSPIPRSIVDFSSGKTTGVIRGVVSAVQHPIELASFLIRGAQMLERLTEGWSLAAHAFVDSELNKIISR